MRLLSSGLDSIIRLVLLIRGDLQDAESLRQHAIRALMLPVPDIRNTTDAIGLDGTVLSQALAACS
jgi:hypothetical protein